MPANKNAETRYQILDRLLANRYRHYSTEDLRQLVNEELAELYNDPVDKSPVGQRKNQKEQANKSSVSLRTIQGDINYLENGPFAADIEHYQIDAPSRNNPYKTVKKNCLRYRDRSFSIYQQKLTDEEKHLLGEAFTLLGQFDGLPNLEGLEKLRSGLNIKQKRQIISFTKNPLENSNLLGELFTVISQKQAVELHYHRFDTPDVDRQMVVHPYMLKEYNRRWFLIAAADVDGKLLTFALDRIDKVVPLPAKEYTPCDDDLNERFEDIVGVTLYEDRPLQTILFWVSDNSKDYVATKPIHESQVHHRGEKEEKLRRQYPMLEGGYFFSIECIENYELLRELTSFGKDLMVLSPANIQEKIIAMITEMAKGYQMLRK